MSENKIWQGRRFKTKAYKTWRTHIGWLLRKKHAETVKGWVAVEVDFYIKEFKRADEMNFLKGFFDALKEGGMIEDDRFIKWHRSEKHAIRRDEQEKITFKIIPLAI